METKTSASILERVRAAREKNAGELGQIVDSGLGGAVAGVAPGALVGAGYGHAKGHTAKGAVRGALRGGMTLGGASAGMTAGSALGASAGFTPMQQLAATLLGGGLGGVGGWKGTDAIIGKGMEEKQARDPSTDAFSSALQGMTAGQLKSDAMKDIANVGLTSLGVGAAGRGLVGLLQMLKNRNPKKTRSGPAYLPLPYPAEAKTAGEKQALSPSSKQALSPPVPVDLTARQKMIDAFTDSNRSTGQIVGTGGGGAAAMLSALSKSLRKSRSGLLALGLGGGLVGSIGGSAMGQYYGRTEGVRAADAQFGKVGSFLGGDAATSKSGIPWYGPAMMLGGLGGLGLGWKGMDKVLDMRRKREQDAEMTAARQEFHDALLDQYDEPIKTHPGLMAKKSEDTSVMEKVGKALDALFEKFEAAKIDEGQRLAEKRAVDWSNLAGQTAGGYGMYAGLSGLLTGALVYDKINKRSRRAVLDKALQQRQRRKFTQQPTEIMAIPEPTEVAAQGAQ